MIRTKFSLTSPTGATLVFSGTGRVKIYDDGIPQGIQYSFSSAMTDPFNISDLPENPFTTETTVEIWAEHLGFPAITRNITVWSWYP